MQYPQFRKAGQPIGSGMVESACKGLRGVAKGEDNDGKRRDCRAYRPFEQAEWVVTTIDKSSSLDSLLQTWDIPGLLC